MIIESVMIFVMDSVARILLVKKGTIIELRVCITGDPVGNRPEIRLILLHDGTCCCPEICFVQIKETHFMKKILIGYSTKHNTTAEIASEIAETLRAMGEFEVDVKDVALVLGLKPYDGVIVGSAIYTGHWLSEGVSFLSRYKDHLKRKPLWLFACGPLGNGAEVTPKDSTAVPDDMRELVDLINPRDIALFSGKLDPSQLGFVERAMSTLVGAPRGDFRDWEAIHAWARNIGESLIDPKPEPSAEYELVLE